MADKTPAEKLRLKPGMKAAFLHLPEGLEQRLGVPDDVMVVADPATADFVLDYASTQSEAVERLAALQPIIGPKTITWMAYPKGSKAKGYDISRDTIWDAAQANGLVLNANVSIDEVLSAVRMRPA